MFGPLDFLRDSSVPAPSHLGHQTDSFNVACSSGRSLAIFTGKRRAGTVPECDEARYWSGPDLVDT